MKLGASCISMTTMVALASASFPSRTTSFPTEGWIRCIRPAMLYLQPYWMYIEQKLPNNDCPLFRKTTSSSGAAAGQKKPFGDWIPSLMNVYIFKFIYPDATTMITSNSTSVVLYYALVVLLLLLLNEETGFEMMRPPNWEIGIVAVGTGATVEN